MSDHQWKDYAGRKVYRGQPHQGARECARRRGDWKAVSVIDAFKRYPYGINRRFPSITNPDRVDVDYSGAVPKVVAPAGNKIVVIGRK